MSSLLLPPRRTVAEVIEDVGFGPAQILILIFGAGGWNFLDSAICNILAICATSMAADLNVPPQRRHLPMTLANAAALVGYLLSGTLGDTFGRKPPIVLSYLLFAICIPIAVLMPTYSGVAAVFSLANFAHALGMAPSFAHLSESTPTERRILTRSMSIITNPLGCILTCFYAATDDPTLVRLSWRTFVWILAALGLLLFLGSWLLLLESPAFFAASGRRDLAQHSFRQLARLNQRFEVDVAYTVEDASSQQGSESARQQFATVFGRRYVVQTLVLCFAMFVYNLTLFGTMYGIPIVLQTTASFAPVWQIAYNSLPFLLTTATAPFLFWFASQKAVPVVGFVLAGVCLELTLAGGLEPSPRPLGFEVLFQSGMLGVSATFSMSIISLAQISVAMYPTTASSTGGAVINTVGQVGCCLGPALFEFVRSAAGWPAFWHILAALNLVTAAMLFLVPSAWLRDYWLQPSPGDAAPSYGAAVFESC